LNSPACKEPTLRPRGVNVHHNSSLYPHQCSQNILARAHGYPSMSARLAPPPRRHFCPVYKARGCRLVTHIKCTKSKHLAPEQQAEQLSSTFEQAPLRHCHGAGLIARTGARSGSVWRAGLRRYVVKVTGRTWVPDRGGSRLDAFPLEADLSGPIASVRVRLDCAYACSVRW